MAKGGHVFESARLDVEMAGRPNALESPSYMRHAVQIGELPE